MNRESLHSDDLTPLDAKGYCGECNMWHYDDKCEKCVAIELYDGSSQLVKEELKALIEEEKPV